MTVQSLPGALAGVRVLEFTALIAGPSAARYLSDHGAEVIKIERFPGGDASRTTNRGGIKRSAMFIQHNGGKKSLCIDLTKPAGLEIARDLVRKSDVVIEAYTPGVMAKLGLGYEDLKALKPTIILCSISGFGQTGPNAHRPGYAHIAHSMTGWLAMQSMYRNPPQVPQGPGRPRLRRAGAARFVPPGPPRRVSTRPTARTTAARPADRAARLAAAAPGSARCEWR